MDNYYNKHYIRLDGSDRIIKGFSDAFETAEDTDICINLEGGRHFELNGVVNPPLVNDNGCHLYKYIDSTITEATTVEIAAELATFATTEETYTQEEYFLDLDYRLSLIELGVA